MKMKYTFIIFMLLLTAEPIQVWAVILPINTSIDTVIKPIAAEQKAIFQIQSDDKNAKTLSNGVRVFGILFVALLLLTLAVPFGTKGVVALLALLCLLVALFLALAGIENAKDKEARKKARKSLWFVLGVFLGVIALGIIVLLNVRIA